MFPGLKNLMLNDQSVTWWVAELKGGEEQAAQELWERYFHRMAALARQRLGEGGRRVRDENDIALSAFKSLCEGAERGELTPSSRDDLWRLLARITIRKVAQQFRDEGRQKRGGGTVRGESVLDGATDGFDGIAGPEPTPAFLHQLADEHARLLAAPGDDVLRRIAVWKLEGWTGAEMATELGITRRSVERKLERIRELWKGELN